MRVLQINSVCGVGSTGRIATDLHSILKEQGHESYIAYGRGEAKNCDNAIKIGNRLDNYFHVAQTRLFDRHGLGSYWATKKFIKQVDELNPDIIHLHNIHGYYINIKILFDYLKEIDKPVVWTLHDCWSFTGHCAYFDYANCNKWETGCYECIEKKQYPSSFMFENSKKNYANKKKNFTKIENLTLVTPSKWLAELVKKSFLQEYPIKVINNGIDLNIFKPNKGDFIRKFNLEGKFIILGVASVWERRKGLNYFIELANKLSKDEIIVLVGLTEQQIKQIPKSIVGITRTDNIQELVDIYSSADVFVNPTLEDNYPTTNLEALSCGLPVVTFNTGGSPESIDDKTGIKVTKGDIEEMIEAINTIKNKEKLSEGCILRAKMFNKNDKFIEYIDLYNQINDKVKPKKDLY